MGKIVSKARQTRLNYAARIGRTVTVEEVAEAAGVDRGALTRLEQGKTRRYDGELLEKVCAFYGIGVGDILEIVGDGSQKNRAPQLTQRRLPVG